MELTIACVHITPDCEVVELRQRVNCSEGYCSCEHFGTPCGFSEVDISDAEDALAEMIAQLRSEWCLPVLAFTDVEDGECETLASYNKVREFLNQDLTNEEIQALLDNAEVIYE